MEEFDIHHHKRTLEAKLRWLDKTGEVNEADKQLILDFYKDSVARGLSITRNIKYLILLSQLSKMLKVGFKNARKTHIKDLIIHLEQSKYSDWSKKDFKVAIKRFYKWLKGKDEEFPEVIKWLKPKLRNEKHKLPEELLTVEEVEKLANATTNSRDKALILVMYESGCRIGELLYLKLKNVQFDNYGGVLLVNGKTGSRRVRIIASIQVLSQWLHEHPDKDNPNAPLWPSRLGRYEPIPVSYPSILAMLDRARKASGVKKRIYPHLFRHSRATALASKLTEAQMKEYFGWTQCSDMAAIYVHLSGRDVDSTLLQMYSLKETPAEKEPKLDVRICHRCKERNHLVNHFVGDVAIPLMNGSFWLIITARQTI